MTEYTTSNFIRVRVWDRALTSVEIQEQMRKKVGDMESDNTSVAQEEAK